MKIKEEVLRKIRAAGLRDYVERVTKRSKGGNYVCPLCKSGTGKDHSGAFSIEPSGEKWKCFKCQKGGDVLDLIGEVEHIYSFTDRVKRAAEYFGIPVEWEENSSYYRRSTAAEDFAPENQNQPKTERNKQQRKPEQMDFRAFYLQANKNLCNTDYHRGISLDTLNRFNVGFVESWKLPLEIYLKNHPEKTRESWEKLPTSPRLIIPITDHSYIARDTRPQLTEEQSGYKKQKIGGQDSPFNVAALWTALRPIFIVEGELDALSIIDVGGEAIALGSTAYKNIFLNCLDRHIPEEPLIIAMDSDNAGQKAAAELAAEFEKRGLVYIECELGTKDANELLQENRELLKKKVAAEAAEAVAQAAELKRIRLAELQEKSGLGYLEQLKEEIELGKQGKGFIPTGFPYLDKQLQGGFYPSLYFVGAVSSLGKTAFVLQLVDQIAQRGQDILFYSLEMASTELISRSLSRNTFLLSWAKTQSKSLAQTTRGIGVGWRYKYYSQEQLEVIGEAMKAYSHYGQYIHFREGVADIGVDQIREEVESFIELTGKKPLVVIDYLQILAPRAEDRKLTDKQRTDEAVKELKRISRDNKIAIVGISSFNRENYSAPVNMASFKESGAIEYSSDVLIGLQYSGMDYIKGEKDAARTVRIREIYEKANELANEGEAQLIELKMLKGRNEGRHAIQFSFRPMFNYFQENLVQDNKAAHELPEREAEEAPEEEIINFSEED